MENLPLDRPLVFGDLEQIKALKDAEMRNEFDKLTYYETCDGVGTCETCEQDCPKCDGVGKDWNAYQDFKELYPNWKGK